MASTLVGTAKTCKSKAHARYSDALEGLYIQTHLASVDLAAILMEAKGRSSDSRETGTYIHLNEHRVREVEDRLAFGRSELAAAAEIVDRHLVSGRCPHNPKA